jgi:hypothetical protein
MVAAAVATFADGMIARPNGSLDVVDRQSAVAEITSQRILARERAADGGGDFAAARDTLKCVGESSRGPAAEIPGSFTGAPGR